MSVSRSRFLRVSVRQPDTGEWKEAGILSTASKAYGFRYASTYDGIPLDPTHLDYYADGRMFAGGGTMGDGTLHNAFAALLPGSFASRAAETFVPGWRNMADADKLAALASMHDRKAAIRLCPVEGNPVRVPVVEGWKAAGKAMGYAVEAYRQRLTGIPPGLLRSFGMGEGGARPKADVTLTDGTRRIVKFNTDADLYDMATVEHLMHRMSADAGVPSVASAVRRLGGVRVLVMSRFDEDRSGGPLYRLPLTALTDRGSPIGGDYEDILAVVARVCPEDTDRLFRQMVFHAAINDTDNHLFNFELIAREDGRGWTLAPNFDALPDPARTPAATAFCGHPVPLPEMSFIERLASRFGVDPGAAKPVLETIVRLDAYLERSGLTDRDKDLVRQAVPHEKWAAVAEGLDALGVQVIENRGQPPTASADAVGGGLLHGTSPAD